MLALGDSMQRFIKKEMQLLGTNMIYVFPGGTAPGGAARARRHAVADPGRCRGA